MGLNIPEATLVGLLLETGFYGAYVVLFLAHIRILWTRRSSSWTYSYQLATTLVLFLTITAHTCVEIVQAVKAFTGPNPATVLTAVQSPISRAKLALWVVSVLVGDLFLVYRVYVLYGRSLLASAFPFLLWLTVLGVSSWGHSTMAHTPPNAFGAKSSKTWLAGKFPMIFSLALNVVCTALIAGRLWAMQRQTQLSYGSTETDNPILRALVIVMESAAVYVSCLTAMVTLQLLSSPYFFMVFAVISPLMGLVFSVIIVRSTDSFDIAKEPVDLSMHFRTRDQISHSSSDVIHTSYPKEV